MDIFSLNPALEAEEEKFILAVTTLEVHTSFFIEIQLNKIFTISTKNNGKNLILLKNSKN